MFASRRYVLVHARMHAYTYGSFLVWFVFGIECSYLMEVGYTSVYSNQPYLVPSMQEKKEKREEKDGYDDSPPSTDLSSSSSFPSYSPTKTPRLPLHFLSTAFTDLDAFRLPIVATKASIFWLPSHPICNLSHPLTHPHTFSHTSSSHPHILSHTLTHHHTPRHHTFSHPLTHPPARPLSASSYNPISTPSNHPLPSPS